GLTRTRSAVESLRDLLSRPADADEAAIGRRRAEVTPSAAITETIDLEDALSWFQGALGELYATLDAQGVPATDPAGGIFSADLFTHARGQATIFFPCGGTVRPRGGVPAVAAPAAELATIAHIGPHSGIDIAYATLAAHVAEHALAVEG